MIESNIADPRCFRKVSVASTASTQADDERSYNTKDSVRKGSYQSKTLFHHTFLSSDISELSCGSEQRKVGIENSKQEMQAKSYDNGLLAIVPCPREAPERSTSLISTS